MMSAPSTTVPTNQNIAEVSATVTNSGKTTEAKSMKYDGSQDKQSCRGPPTSEIGFAELVSKVGHGAPKRDGPGLPLWTEALNAVTLNILHFRSKCPSARRLASFLLHYPAHLLEIVIGSYGVAIGVIGPSDAHKHNPTIILRASWSGITRRACNCARDEI
ncbi:hypothetical protein K438DRAFT_1782195 [Mycena galopus ATCC 62051]|nr:hypothetical protein K438DRAFT_1782195 [Mycena galopus ATCC 62051]